MPLVLGLRRGIGLRHRDWSTGRRWSCDEPPSRAGRTTAARDSRDTRHRGPRCRARRVEDRSPAASTSTSRDRRHARIADALGPERLSASALAWRDRRRRGPPGAEARPPRPRSCTSTRPPSAARRSPPCRPSSDHARRESEVGGYVAQDRASAQLNALRRDVAGLLGTDADGVAFVESAMAALDALVQAWPLAPGARVLVAPSEWGPNLELLDRHGLATEPIPTDADGVVDLEALAGRLGSASGRRRPGRPGLGPPRAGAAGRRDHRAGPRARRTRLAGRGAVRRPRRRTPRGRRGRRDQPQVADRSPRGRDGRGGRAAPPPPARTTTREAARPSRWCSCSSRRRPMSRDGSGSGSPYASTSTSDPTPSPTASPTWVVPCARWPPPWTAGRSSTRTRPPARPPRCGRPRVRTPSRSARSLLHEHDILTSVCLPWRAPGERIDEPWLRLSPARRPHRRGPRTDSGRADAPCERRRAHAPR